jgi:hypothetical protein
VKYPTEWPALMWPMVEDPNGTDGALIPDKTRTAWAFQHIPGRSQELAEWADGGIRHWGEIVVQLPNRDLVYLGDFALRDTLETPAYAEPADGFWQRWTPADTEG